MTAVEVPLVERESVDPSLLLRLTSAPAKIVAALFMATNVVWAVASLGAVKHALPVLVAVVLVDAAAALLLVKAPDPFPMLWSLGVLAVVALSTLLVAFQLPSSGPIGRAAWHLGANAWILFILALRRRAGLAWLGFALMAGITIAWFISIDRSPLAGLLELNAQTALLFVGSLFALNLRRTARRINELDDQSVLAAADDAEAATSAQIRLRRVSELRASVTPLLERLTEDGPPTSAADRKRYASAEAELRDGVRGRSLVSPAIVAATASARDRGVDVDLLDDRGQVLASADATERMATAIVQALDAASAGTVTVRLAPSGRRAALSIVANTGLETHRVELDVDGRPVTPALSNA